MNDSIFFALFIFYGKQIEKSTSKNLMSLEGGA